MNWTEEVGLKAADPADGGPKYVWVDVETTGLDPVHNTLLEIGLVVTDKYGNVCGDPVGMYLEDDNETRRVAAMANMPDFVRKMHKGSGLLDGIDPYPETASQGTVAISTAEAYLSDWISRHGDPKSLYMAGSTVGFDRFAFLQRYMPEIHETCHHRSVDNSTVKVLCEEHNPYILHGLPKPRKMHRSLPDLVDSIREHQFYLDNFFFIPGGKFDG